MAFPSRLNADRSPLRGRLLAGARSKMPIVYASRILFSKRRASFRGYLTLLWLQYCIATIAGADPDDVDDIPSLSEPHGSDSTMADRGGVGAEISQPRSARRVRQIVRAARRGTGAGLAHLAHLYAPGLRHRQGAGRQPGAGGDRGSHLRDAVRFALAFQEGEFARAAAAVAGGAEVRPLRNAVARHREDPAAGSRRLHHRLA